MNFKKLREFWKWHRSSIITRTAGGTNKNTVLSKWEWNFFVATYIEFAKKSLGSNIVTYVFDNVIKVILLGQETANKVKYISKEFYLFKI